MFLILLGQNLLFMVGGVFIFVSFSFKSLTSCLLFISLGFLICCLSQWLEVRSYEKANKQKEEKEYKK